MNDNELYQFSVMAALMDGVAENGLPLADVRARGDFGLGTFLHMAGEMTVNEGHMWQMTSDGAIREVLPASEVGEAAFCPFAMMTQFRPDLHDVVDKIESKDALGAWLDSHLPARARNQFVAMRLTGTFASVSIRAIPSQKFAGQPLAELTARQHEHTETNQTGTVVGFRSPGFMVGLGVPGLHLHFLSDDGLFGGHILALDTVGSGEPDADGTGGTDGKIKFEAAIMHKMHLDLPRDDPDYNAAPLDADREAIHKAEG